MRSMVIIPTYNERENLPLLTHDVLNTDPSIDVLVVDDGSPDGTGEIADGLARESNRVHVLHRQGKQGLGTAYLNGFRYALDRDYGRIVQMDADFSHRPEYLPHMLRTADIADVVIGSRNVPGGQVESWPLIRQLVSKGGSLYTRVMLGLPIYDCTSGFKCFRREVLTTIDFDRVRSNGFGFQVEVNFLCHQAGFRVVEVPITFPDRLAGTSKMSSTIFLEAAMVVWQLRREAHGSRLPEGKPNGRRVNIEAITASSRGDQRR